MLNKIELTLEDRKAILADFQDWSGGFEPVEVSQRSIRSYAAHGADTKFDTTTVLAVLADERKFI